MPYYAPFYQPYTNYTPNAQSSYNNANFAQNGYMNTQQTQPVPTATGLIWVDSEQQVNDYLVAPNSAVPLFHRTEPILYVKSTDGVGMIKVDKYKMVQYTENTPKSPINADNEKDDNFVVKDEINAINGKIKALTARCEHLERSQSENETSKPKIIKKVTKGIDE